MLSPSISPPHLSLSPHSLTMDNNRTDKTTHSKPISINTTAGHHHRHRSASVSSDSSDGSPSDPIRTPLTTNPPKVTTVSPSSSTSPFFSYIMGQQPAAKTFPFRRSTVDSISGTGPVFDDGRLSIRIFKYPHVDAQIDDPQEPAPLHKVHRRATTSWTATGPNQPMNPLAGDRQERASGLLRRLSLSTSFSKVHTVILKTLTSPSDALRYQPPGFGGNDQPPAVPPNTAFPNSPTNSSTPGSPPRKPARRAPSPMGERILKGHFDGFN